MKFRAAYEYDVEAASNEATRDLDHKFPSLTVQSMAEDADINVLMKRFGLTGKMPENPRVPSYGDFEGISDYQSALDQVRYADQAFAELTPEVRLRFENNPQNLLEFVANGANVEEARRLGLLKESSSGASSQGAGGAPGAAAVPPVAAGGANAPAAGGGAAVGSGAAGAPAGR